MSIAYVVSLYLFPKLYASADSMFSPHVSPVERAADERSHLWTRSARLRERDSALRRNSPHSLGIIVPPMKILMGLQYPP